MDDIFVVCIVVEVLWVDEWVRIFGGVSYVV